MQEFFLILPYPSLSPDHRPDWIRLDLWGDFLDCAGKAQLFSCQDMGRRRFRITAAGQFILNCQRTRPAIDYRLLPTIDSITPSRPNNIIPVYRALFARRIKKCPTPQKFQIT
jgi:hypothetical protein